MNKKIGMVAGMFLLLIPTAQARDIYDMDYQRELRSNDGARALEMRRESTRRIGNDLPRTQQIAPIYGNSPAYIHQDNSGTYLLNSFGQPVGIIGR